MVASALAALEAASHSLRNREILGAVGTTAAALSTTDADGSNEADKPLRRIGASFEQLAAVG